jgi:hypothetical protein
MKVAPSSEIDLNAIILAILARVGPVTISRETLNMPQVNGMPVVGFRVDISVTENTLTILPMKYEEMMGAIQQQLLADSPNDTEH